MNLKVILQESKIKAELIDISQRIRTMKKTINMNQRKGIYHGRYELILLQREYRILHIAHTLMIKNIEEAHITTEIIFELGIETKSETKSYIKPDINKIKEIIKTNKEI